MEDSDKIRVFFDRAAKEFDAYYLDEKKPLFWKIMDFTFRRSIQKRLKLALEECKGPKPVSVLDVGCGSGRFAVRLLRQGQAAVTCVDFSSEMIKIAREVAEEYRVQDRCRFILGDFKDVGFAEKFDICVALGFFDYTEDPASYLQKMKSTAVRKIVASFPAKWRLRNIVRVIRLAILGCPVHFYTRGRIEGLLRDLSVQHFEIQSIGRDYFVVATLS